jgi:GH25 family lysozyme M1 (1,4-beta-N-acetylmuramidase)
MAKLPKSAYHQELGRLGGGLKYYHPKRNIHSIINRIVTGETLAFPGLAVIIQNKKFPDTSFYQGLINWDVMRSKTDTIILRAGQNLWADSMFLINYAEAKRRGMRRGVYWFYDDRVSPGAQAALLITLIAGDLPELEIFCDWEKSYGGGFGGLKNVVAFMQAIERAFPSARVGMYTGYYWFIEHSNALLNWSQYQYLKDRALWLGYYANSIQVKIPAPWTALTHWQYGTPAEQWGQQTYEIDLNFYNGTDEEFYLRYGGGEVLPPPDEPEEGTVMQGTVRTGRALIIRDATGGDTGKRLAAGDVVYGAVTGGRIYFHRVYRLGTTVEETPGNAATVDPANPATSYMILADVAEPVTEPEPTPPDFVVAHWVATAARPAVEKRYLPE